MKNTRKSIKKEISADNSIERINIIDNKAEFFNIIADIANNETVKKMREYKQHCDTNCYTHCLHVAYYSYLVSRKLGLDYKSTARAAMLHDLFLYDWRIKYRDSRHYGFHGFVHPKIALDNALELFELNDKEQDIIVKHMWPMTVILPKYKESYLVTVMDKYSAIKEIYNYYQSKIRRKTVYRYAYVFLSLLLIRIV